MRLGGEERLIKVFSGGYNNPEIQYEMHKLLCVPIITHKKRFEMERTAYAHLVHYGACDGGASPMCYGWVELSSLHIAKVNTLIAAALEDYSPAGPRCRPPFVDPIFGDGSPPTALVLEYISNTEVLDARNLTYPLAEAAMRAFARVHGAYVLHEDLTESRNILIAKGDLESDRVVVGDFDHASDMSSGTLRRSAFREEL